MRLGGWLQSAPLYIPRRNRLKAILKAQDRSEVAKKDAPEVSKSTGGHHVLDLYIIFCTGELGV